MPTICVIKNGRSLRERCARPCPIDKGGFKRLSARVGVEVAAAAPAQIRGGKVDRDTRRRRYRPPEVAILGVQGEALAIKARRFKPDRAANTRGQRDRHLVDVDRHRRSVPRQAACADLEPIPFAHHLIASAFRHRPPLAAGAIERDIYGAMIERIAAAGPSIIRREHAADKRDDGQTLLSIVAERIDIPPGIAARLDRPIEARSITTLAAACLPDNAAIGTPGPG